MADYFFTGNAQSLLDLFNEKIDQEEPKGKITTWKRSDDRVYYTHSSANWNKKAWFKPVIEPDRLIFNIIKPKSSNITTMIYGYYHGHLIETFLNHFDQEFSSARASPLPASGDICS
jgi:hypothetical protein